MRKQKGRKPRPGCSNSASCCREIVYCLPPRADDFAAYYSILLSPHGGDNLNFLEGVRLFGSRAAWALAGGPKSCAQCGPGPLRRIVKAGIELLARPLRYQPGRPNCNKRHSAFLSKSDISGSREHSILSAKRESSFAGAKASSRIMPKN